MADEVNGRAHEQRVRFVAEAQSVPVARRFVTDSVSGSSLPTLAEDAALLVTELSSNAALHSGSRYFDVVVEARPEAVRIGVADDGPAGAVAARPSALLALDDWDSEDLDPADALALEATTGRGLVMVSAVADRWGVDETEDGKLVWGELRAAGRDAQPWHRSAPEGVPALPTLPETPPEWVRMQMVDLPVDLARRHDEHLWELVRELQLLAASPTDWTGDMATLIEELVGRHSGSWRLSQAVVAQGAAEGRDALTLELVVPVTVVDDVQALKQVLDLTDRLCERDELLTLASSPDVRRVRAWMTHELVRQIRDGAAPVPWQEFQEPAGPSTA